MSLSVQTSFDNPQLKNKDFTTMINSGDCVFNNFIYGVKQPVNYFDFIKAKNCLKYNYTAEMLNDVLKHLSCNSKPIVPPAQETICINNTTILEEDVWDSIQW